MLPLPHKILSRTLVEILQNDFYSHFRAHYNGQLMANLGLNQETGDQIIREGKADLVSFGQFFISNPDLVERFRYHLPLSEADPDNFYAGEEKGYTG